VTAAGGGLLTWPAARPVWIAHMVCGAADHAAHFVWVPGDLVRQAWECQAAGARGLPHAVRVHAAGPRLGVVQAGGRVVRQACCARVVRQAWEAEGLGLRGLLVKAMLLARLAMRMRVRPACQAGLLDMVDSRQGRDGSRRCQDCGCGACLMGPVGVGAGRLERGGQQAEQGRAQEEKGQGQGETMPCRQVKPCHALPCKPPLSWADHYGARCLPPWQAARDKEDADALEDTHRALAAAGH
jgi:hypothetical protein